MSVAGRRETVFTVQSYQQSEVREPIDGVKCVQYFKLMTIYWARYKKNIIFVCAKSQKASSNGLELDDGIEKPTLDDELRL